MTLSHLTLTGSKWLLRLIKRLILDIRVHKNHGRKKLKEFSRIFKDYFHEIQAVMSTKEMHQEQVKFIFYFLILALFHEFRHFQCHDIKF